MLLVDDATASAAEIVAAALQEAGRALVVGEPSRGAVLPAAVAPLPNGAKLEYAIADYLTPRGERLERRGVTPDLVVRAIAADNGAPIPLLLALELVPVRLYESEEALLDAVVQAALRPAAAHFGAVGALRPARLLDPWNGHA